jgi:hypothetical protein
MDTMHTAAYQDLQHLHMDPPEPVPGQGDHWQLPEVTDAAIDTLFANFGPALLMAEIRHGGGAVASLGGPYHFFGGGMAATPQMHQDVWAALATLRTAMAPHVGTQHYANFVEHPDVDPAEIWDPATLERLRAVKAAIDPHDVIRSNHPIG